MGKIKVEELALRMKVSVDVMIKRIQKLNPKITKPSDLVDENIFQVKKSENTSSPHIIRRKVKVVTTDEKGNKIERITTNTGGVIQKTSIIHEKPKEEKITYNKEDLGVVRSKHNRNNMQNIVVTQNGKKIDTQKQTIKTNVERTKENIDIKESLNKEVNIKQTGLPKNKETFQKREYVDKRRPFQNKTTSDSTKRGFNTQRRPFQNKNTGSDFQNRNNTGYKVNQFIKESQITDTIQKETRDYGTALIDKKKYNTERNTMESKAQKKNINEMREQNTRVDFNKYRGMQVSEEGLIELYDRGETRKYFSRRKKQKPKFETTKIIPLLEVKLPETMTVKYFAECLKKQASEIIKKLFSLGILATINQEIDFDTAYIIAEEFGITAEKEVVVTEEDVLFDDTDDDDKNMVSRPPIVTVMGHVDHGKTSLLDKIRSAHVVSGESGGITQHIGAYKLKINNKEITFLDTPGHEAFTEMRARGAGVTDIVVIVVAADDSIKPQTIEAIQHAKAAGVSIIVAINKIDVIGANIEKVKQDLLEQQLVPEEWGGDTVCVPVSAKTGEGIDNLLEMILLVADVKELKANPKKQAKGTVIEAKLDKTRGAIATVLVQRGTLNVGDTIVLGDIVGKIRNMINDRGEKVKKAGPSTPVELLGLGAVPETGDIFYEVKDEKTANKLIAKRKAQHREDLIKKGSTLTLDALYNKIKDEEIKNLDIVLRGDVKGSIEALKDSLEKLSNDEVKVNVITKNTGAITESDITLAQLSNAIVIGFNVKIESNAAKIADKEKVDVRLYNVIYDAISDIETAMKGLLKPTYEEVVTGSAEVRDIFKVSSLGTIAGCYIKSGKVLRNAIIRVMRNDVVVAEVKLDSLKREKDDVKEVKEGYECGIKLDGFNDILVGDILECFELVEKER